MKHPNPDMLLRIAQGDAYAIAVEYVSRKEHPKVFEALLNFEGFQQHPTYNKLSPGMYTDDTQMSIAVAETLILTNDPSSRDFAEAFFRCFKRDERDGYSRKFQAILEKVRTVDEMLKAIIPDSTRNGAAMRAVPIGVIDNPGKVVLLAGFQGAITHATWGGVNSAGAVALMSHFALHSGDDFDRMYDFCVQVLPAFDAFKEPWTGPVHHKIDPKGLGVGMMTAHAVFTLLTTESSMMDMLKTTIEWGGDTDSVAAIALGIASARHTTEKLPDFLEEKLEVNGEFGVDFLKDLGKQLMAAY